jgi:hypothetical protein
MGKHTLLRVGSPMLPTLFLRGVPHDSHISTAFRTSGGLCALAPIVTGPGTKYPSHRSIRQHHGRMHLGYLLQTRLEWHRRNVDAPTNH